MAVNRLFSHDVDRTVAAGPHLELALRSQLVNPLERMASLLLALLGGLAGSMHCVGMCGIFPLALAEGSAPGTSAAARQLLYHFGRLNTLTAIGALAGTVGAAFVGQGSFVIAERVLAIAAGAFMVVVGLEQLGLLAPLTERGAALVRSAVGAALGGVLRSPSPLAPIALGVFNAFLPCQLIYAFAAQAASTASVAGGAATMLAFGLGTIPAMLALGLSPTLFTPGLRRRIARAGAVLVIAFGLVTAARGVWPNAGHSHAHHQASALRIFRRG